MRSGFSARQNGEFKGFFRYKKNEQVRTVSTTSFEFRDGKQHHVKVHHYTLSREELDTQEKLISAIQNTIIRKPDSLFFLTEKSRLLRRADNSFNHYLPLNEDELLNISLMQKLIENQWLRPSGGHVSMGITDEEGDIIPSSQVSLRPGRKTYIKGQTTLHPSLYRAGSGRVKSPKHTLIQDEIELLANKIMLDGSITADLTFVPIEHTTICTETVMDNIKSARAIKLYNLCSLIVKEHDIQLITDETIHQAVLELRQQAEKDPDLQNCLNDTSEIVLSALACTHAIVRAIFGDEFVLDRQLGSDQDTQTAVVYCTMALIGTNRFLDFAKSINFHDIASNLTKKFD